jgi:hypothetical protein
MRLATLVSRSARKLAALALVAAATLAMTTPTRGGQPDLADLLDDWFTWAFGGNHPDHDGRVKFLPLPAGAPVDDGTGTFDDPVTLRGEIDVTLKKNQSFVLPLAAWTREVYGDGTIDPAVPDSVFLDSHLVLKIDGKTVLDSATDDLSAYYVPTTALDRPVQYAEPTSYGSVGLVGFQGIGIELPPLPVGEHTMTLSSEVFAVVADANHPVNTGMYFENTWNITVRK